MSDAQLGTRSLRTLLGDWRIAASGPSYLALFDRIRLLILDGRIPADTRLPAERDLAQALEVSRTMVTAAYRELREAGYTSVLRGSGSVTRLPGRAMGPANESGGTGLIDFTRATLPAAPGILAATEAALAGYSRYLGGTGLHFAGIPELRNAVAARYTARGLPTTPDQILITNGAQHAIFLVSRVLLARGDRALVEQPSYPHASDALLLAGARLVPVSVTVGAGWDVAALETAIRRTSPVLGYLMPDFHNPTGESMSEGLREKVIGLAQGQGTVLLVDETAGELDIDRAGDLLPFAAYADAGQQSSVITIGSVGKSVWDGLRVGWVRADAGIIQKLTAARPAGDFGTPVLEQLVVAELLADMDGILAARRGQLRVGRDHVLGVLAERFPEWTPGRPAGGIATWVNLGSAVSSQLTLAARGHGLLITAGPRFGQGGTLERFLRIPISFPVPELDRGLTALALAWRSLPNTPLAESQVFADVV
jgi:DNA-binding transcriptional MocR family regulator